VVFVHGSGDRASLGCIFDGFDRMPGFPGSFGWMRVGEAFKRKGYSNAELYGTTLGSRRFR